MANISVFHPTSILKGKIHLPASKSESNRALILQALTHGEAQVYNLASARDTQTMIRLLASKDPILDVLDAGTTMRFLTAFTALGKEEKVLTGTARMCERPIALLVDALRTIGADISYEKEEGYPPIRVKGIQKQKQDHIQIAGDVSSQYISALCMIAPCLPLGLNIELTGVIASRPYLNMTLQMMSEFGITYSFEGQIIAIKPQKYQATTFYAESDWSGASYWYSMVALAKEADLTLTGLKKNSLQGDSAIVDIMKVLGVETVFGENEIRLIKTPVSAPKPYEIDFTHCPDIAQTLSVIAGGLNSPLVLRGVESLKIKETDRLAALKNELRPFGVAVNTLPNQEYSVSGLFQTPSNYLIKTYHDHRMAMSFAPLGLLTKVCIEDDHCVVKSYPSFWDDLKSVGFEIKEI